MGLHTLEKKRKTRKRKKKGWKGDQRRKFPPDRGAKKRAREMGEMELDDDDSSTSDSPNRRYLLIAFAALFSS